ncbi:hypothetical protein B296_00039447 [Ensete ventricosum]|uniref:Uncharacterized protein n=1 Tax=Ensete ventricosum TaxID=4639 RepID=A0A426X6Y5_ENSVE|nr:hypothetical protein B296_00039447 [Ensete ventricosum]
MSVVVVSSTSALSDSETADALAVMRFFFNVDSIMTACRLVKMWKNYFIPLEYKLHVPLLRESPYDDFPYDDLEAGLRFPLHPVIEACLEHFPTEWTSRTVSSSVPALSTDETELVKILRGSFPFHGGKECWVSTVEKRPISSAEVGLRKRLRKVVAEQPADASGSTARTSADKGKGIVELGEGEDPLVSRWSTISTSNPFWTEGPLSGEYLRGALHPTLAKQVYECSSEELMNRAGKSAAWHEKILALRAANKELKASVGQELAAAAERQVKELEAEIERMRTELESLRSQRREFEQEKVVAAYKASRGFESSLEKMGRVSYEFGYQVVLERLRGKHPDVMIELDPLAKCPEDANIKMYLDQPFDDGTPSE